MIKIELDTIESALEDIRNGKIVIVVDDEDRENEGDFVAAAQNVLPETINFMAKYGRGLICAPMTERYCQRFELDMMVGNNTSVHTTPFTVSIDYLHKGCTTGISAYDRATTIQALIDPNTKPADFGRPGHIFPLKANEQGVIQRVGHTEATIDLARLAGFEPVGVLCEIMNDDGTMARLPELKTIATQHNLKLISIKDLIAYRLKTETLVERKISVQMPTKYGDFDLLAFQQTNNSMEHLALTKGTWNPDEPVLVRVHSSCMTGDIFGSCRCDCGEQLQKAMQIIEKEGKGVIVYLNQEGRGIGLMNKLKAYQLQEQGMDTVEANEALGFGKDERNYGIGAQILRNLGVSKMRLLSNNPTKRAGLIGYGLEIVEHIPLQTKPNKHNIKYLQTKQTKMGHDI